MVVRVDRDGAIAEFEAAVARFLRSNQIPHMQAALSEALALFHEALHADGYAVVEPLYSCLQQARGVLPSLDHQMVWESARNAAVIDRATYCSNVCEWDEALGLVADLDALLKELDQRRSDLGLPIPPRTDLHVRRLMVLADVCALGPRGITDGFGTPLQFVRGYAGLLAQADVNYSRRWATAGDPERVVLRRSYDSLLQTLSWCGLQCACVGWRFAPKALPALLDLYNTTHSQQLGLLRASVADVTASPQKCWWDAYKAYQTGSFARDEVALYCDAIRRSLNSDGEVRPQNESVLRGIAVLEALMYSRLARLQAGARKIEVA